MLADSLAQRVSLVQSSRERITSLGENWFISSVVKCTSLIHPPCLPFSFQVPRFPLFCFHSFRTLLLPPRFPGLPTPSHLFPSFPYHSLSTFSLSVRHGFKNVYDEARCP